MPAPSTRLGISVASYGARQFGTALEMLNHAHQLGAGGIQTGVRRWEPTLARQLRARQEVTGLAIEGQISLPADATAVPEFERQIQCAKEAGVSVVRTVALSGRRYETFQDLSTFKRFQQRAVSSLTLAEAVVARHGVILAVENHKDWLIPELLDILAKLSSASVGVCLDTGNSMSLLEDPMEVVAAYAPFTVTTHFKDMDVRPHKNGFLLSEVPLGEGVLDLKRIIELCARHRPDVRHNLEMITRDPLEIPCLEPVFWTTFAERSGQDLAESLRLVNGRTSLAPLPRVSHLSKDERIAVEESNVRRSFDFARAHLGL